LWNAWPDLKHLTETITGAVFKDHIWTKSFSGWVSALTAFSKLTALTEKTLLAGSEVGLPDKVRECGLFLSMRGRG